MHFYCQTHHSTHFCFSNNAALRSRTHIASPAHSAVKAPPLSLSLCLTVMLPCTAQVNVELQSWPGLLAHLADCTQGLSATLGSSCSNSKHNNPSSQHFSQHLLLRFAATLMEPPWGLWFDSSCRCSTSHIERWRSCTGKNLLIRWFKGVV